MRSVLIYLPARIQAKFAKYHNLPTQVRYTYMLSGLIFESAKVSTEYFRKCWIHLHPLLSDDELFSLFKDSGFSPRPYERAGRLVFVRNVLQQYKAATVYIFGGIYVHVSLAGLLLLWVCIFWAFGLLTYTCTRLHGRSLCLHA